MSEIHYRHITPIEDREYESIVQTLADTTASNAKGSSASTTTYLLEPRIWMKEIVDAGKKRLRFAEAAIQRDIPKGNANAIIPKRKAFLSGSAWGATVTPGTAVNYTTMNNFDGVEVVPAWKNYGIAVTYDTIQQNVVDYVSQAREELSYRAGDNVDQDLVTTISGATQSSSTAVGAQTVFGGDAGAASSLAAGDVITTDMVAEGMRRLQSNVVRYWTGGTDTAIALTTAQKNPWINDNDFTLIIAPEQEEAFRTDSQFINAAEYGSDKVIMNGEIGNYLGVKVIVSVNTKQDASGSVGTIDGSTAATDINSCLLTKAKKGYALAYLKRPTLHVVDFPRELEVDLILEQAYGSSAIQEDAIVNLVVAQK